MRRPVTPPRTTAPPRCGRRAVALAVTDPAHATSSPSRRWNDSLGRSSASSGRSSSPRSSRSRSPSSCTTCRRSPTASTPWTMAPFAVNATCSPPSTASPDPGRESACRRRGFPPGLRRRAALVANRPPGPTATCAQRNPPQAEHPPRAAVAASTPNGLQPASQEDTAATRAKAANGYGGRGLGGNLPDPSVNWLQNGTKGEFQEGAAH